MSVGREPVEATVGPRTHHGSAGTVANVRDDLTDGVRSSAAAPPRGGGCVSVGFAAGLLIVLGVLVATVLGTGDDAVSRTDRR